MTKEELSRLQLAELRAEGWYEGFASGKSTQKATDLGACDWVADLYGEDSERGLAAAEIKRRILNG